MNRMASVYARLDTSRVPRRAVIAFWTIGPALLALGIVWLLLLAHT